MRMEVQNQITMLGNGVAMELPRRRDSHRRWYWLGPWDGQIQLREVEQPADADPEEWTTPETDPVRVSTESFPSVDAAIATLTERGIVTNEFDALWKAPNPF